MRCLYNSQQQLFWFVLLGCAYIGIKIELKCILYITGTLETQRSVITAIIISSLRGMVQEGLHPSKLTFSI